MIRDFVTGDGRALALLMRRSIAELGPQPYDKSQVAAWLGRAKSATYFDQRIAAGDAIYIAQSSTIDPAGYCLREADGHLDHLYVDPMAAGQGHASAMLKHCAQISRAEGLHALYSEVSEVARPAFEANGWHTEKRRDLSIDGVAIHNYAMRLAL